MLVIDEEDILVHLVTLPAIYFRKKLSQFSRSKDWKHASNYVAKRYIEEVANKTYFDDVKIQMDAKVWAEEYNKQNPPKKVSMQL